MFRRTFTLSCTAALLAPAAAFSADIALSEGKNYKVIKTPRPDKLTVQVFFAYTCPHCYDYEPFLERWQKTLPESSVQIVWVPVAWTDKSDRFVRTYYALSSLGKLAALHRKFFTAVIEEGRPFETDKSIAEWMVKQGIERGQWESAYNGFGVRSQTARARQAWTLANIDSTPCTVVDGRYLSGPGMCGTHQAAIEVLDKLVRKARAER